MLVFFGILIFWVVHGVALGQAPGLHFDEAWAANEAYRIAFEPGFWPLQGQSAYTVPWNLYPIAAAFKLFGTEVWIFRGVSLAYVFTGFILIRKALVIWGEKRAGDLFFFTSSFLLGLVLNHRFAVEINTFHVFCFGLLLFGLSRLINISSNRKVSLFFVALAVFFGVTSHVLFLTPSLAAALVPLVLGIPLVRDTRVMLLALGAVLSPFFLRIAFLVPERDKALILAAGAGACVLALFFGAGRVWGTAKLRQWAMITTGVISIPFIFLTLIFLEGHWSVLFSVGGLQKSILFGLTLLPGLVLFRLQRKAFWSEKFKPFTLFFFYLCIGVGILMIKPTPRYFELPEVVAALALSLALARYPRSVLSFYFVVVAVFFTLQFSENYLQPIVQGKVRESKFSFLFIKDDSRDHLSKQKLSEMIAAWGCRFESVQSPDSRVMEALKFLSHTSYWKTNSQVQCPSGGVRVYRTVDYAVGHSILAKAYGFTIEKSEGPQ